MAKDRFMIRVAVYVILERNGQVFLMRRYNTGYRDGKYGLPAGHVEADEYADEAAARETFEEAGVRVKSEDLELVHTMHRTGDHDYIDLYFKAPHFGGEPYNAEPEKCDEVNWFSLENLPETIIPEVKQGLEKAAKKVAYSTFHIS